MAISSTSSSSPSSPSTSTSSSSTSPSSNTETSKPVSSPATSTAVSGETSSKPSETTSSVTGSSGGGSAEPNLSAEAARFDSNPGELASGEASASDPENSVEFTGVQAEAAHEVTGELISEETEETEEAGETSEGATAKGAVIEGAAPVEEPAITPNLDGSVPRVQPNPDDPGAPAAPADQALLDAYRNPDGTIQTGTVRNDLTIPHFDVDTHPEVVKAEQLVEELRLRYEETKATSDDQNLIDMMHNDYTMKQAELFSTRQNLELNPILLDDLENASHHYTIINELPEGTTLEMANEMLNRFNAPTTEALKGFGNDPNLTHGYVDMNSPWPYKDAQGWIGLGQGGGHVNLYRGETDDGRAWVQNTTIPGEHPLVGHIVRTIVQDEQSGRFYVVTEGTGQGDMGEGYLVVPTSTRHLVNTIVGPPAFEHLDQRGSEWISAQLAN